MKVLNLTPVLNAAPGERATCRIRIENSESGPVTYRLRVVGFDETQVLRPPPSGPLAAGAIEEIDLQFLIPDAYAAGKHAVAVEVTSDRPGAKPVIAGVTVAIGSIDEVALAILPSTIRGRRRGSFRLDIDSRSAEAIDLELAGEGPDLEVRLRPDRVHLGPGDRVQTSGRVKGPRHLVGEPLQHSLTVVARSRSAPSYVPAAFHQRPLFPRALRTMLAVLLVVAVWVAALGAGLLWWTQRGDEAPQEARAPLVDTDGDGVPDTPGDRLIDTDGDGVADTPASVVAQQVAEGEPQAGGSDVPTRTVVGGTVKAGDTGDDADVTVTLTPMELGAPPPPGAAFVGPAGESRGAVKLWPARAVHYGQVGVADARRTVSVEPVASGPDGAWLFSDVPIRQTYELNLAREGFDSQSFVVVPPADGAAVSIDVVLEPADGELRGVVTGPGGPLGNVDLVLTDGTLTFNTRTATGAEAGTWALSGVSTPGTYTLTATLRGFGTEVLQISLDPGEQQDVNITMAPDVGSIIGRVSSGGEPLGGVTLTASNGEDTLTTTSLTEGDAGRYNFPRLTTPRRYTVTASLDGYVTQTRLVTLGGNVTGVDFDLVETTATIVGVVTSVGPGGADRGPLAGANIRVSRDELAFDTSSSSSREDTGSFTISDLPPGTYVVEFTHFEHRPASQLVTVAAGDRENLGAVPLRFGRRQGITEEGSLEVRVTDSADNDLFEATVTIRDVARENDDDFVARQTDDDGNRASFVFDEPPLPVGTYDVTVERAGFNPATRRVTIGPREREFLTVRLFEQGQVSGQIVDSVDGIPLSDYSITIFRINSDGSREQALLPINVPPGAPRNADGKILWETPPRSLASGTYEVVVSRAPPGYRVVPDQELVDGQADMQFEIASESEVRPELADIEADPFPALRGFVLTPRLDADGTTVTFVPLINDNVEITLQCGREPRTDPSVSDVPGSPAIPYDYEFSRAEVARALDRTDPAGNCMVRVDATADGFELAEFAVQLVASDGSSNPDIVLNVALFEESQVGGSVYWRDDGNGGAEIRLGGVSIATFERVITGFTPTAGNPRPILALGPLAATSDGNGLWVFGVGDNPKQVFGRTSYLFAASNFEGRTIAITIDEDGRTVAPVTPAPGLDLTNGTGNGIGVELDADGGLIEGRVTIRTIKGTSQFPGSTANLGGFAMNLTRVPGGPFVVAPDGARTGVASVTTADPGTYTASITRPDHHVSFDGRPQSGIGLFQEPGEDIGFARTYVELGELNVQVLDGFGAELPSATLDVVHTLDPGIVDDPDTVTIADDEAVDGDGAATFTDLPVNLGDPDGQDVTWAVSPTVADHDVAGSTVTILAETGPPGLPCGPPACAGGVARTGIRAGGDKSVTFTVAEYGSITGNVVGQTRTPIDRTPLPVSDQLTVTARRVGRFGDVFTRPPEAALDVAVDPADTPNGFSVSGPPGWYTIDVSHEEYEVAPLAVPPPDGFLFDPVTFAPVPVFRMDNLTTATPDPNDIATAWVLRVEGGSLELTVHEDTLVGPGVEGAVVTLVDADGLPVDLTGRNLTAADGRLVVERLIPGDYRLTIRKVDALSRDEYFPVIATINIPQGANPPARTRVVDAPLARIGAELRGDVGAVNSEGDPVAVPSVTVSRTYDAPDLEVGSPPTVGNTTATVPNEATESTLVRAPGTAPRPSTITPADATGVPQRYRFENLAAGAHTLTFSDVAGYTAPADVTVVASILDPIPVPDPNVAQVDYVAADRTVVVTVTIPDGPDAGTERDPVGDATVTLTPFVGAARPPPTINATLGTYTFSGVPPELDDYTVSVTRPLFGTETELITVVPGADNAVPIELTPSEAEIFGLARRQTSATASSPVPGVGFARLIALPAETEVGVYAIDPDGSYHFEIPEDEIAAEYEVVIDVPQFAPRTSAEFTIEAGVRTTVPTITVPALATFNVNVAGPAPGNITVAVAQPASQVGVAPTQSGRVFTFRVDPGDPPYPNVAFAYRFTASAPGFISQTVPATATSPNPGQTVAQINVTLAARTVAGRITGAVSGTRVEARQSGSTTLVDTTDAEGDYVITGIGPGDWTIVSERFGTGRDTLDVTIPSATSPSQTGRNFTLDARTVSVSFTTSPAGGSVLFRRGATTVSPAAETSPRDILENLWTLTTGGQLTLTWDATLAAHIARTGTVTVGPGTGGSFDATSFSFDIGQIVFTPNPTTTTTTTTSTTIAPTTTTTTVPPTTTTTTSTTTTTVP